MIVLTWKWKQKGYRSTFLPEHVNVLKNMVRRNLEMDHEFVCITDDAEGLDRDIRVIPLWDDLKNLSSPHGKGKPSCYRRLRMFAEDAKDWLGDRFVSLDLDCVITGSLDPLFERDEDFVIWGDTNPSTFYNGSMILMTAGARKEVWEDFNPHKSPRKTLAAGCHGSDQAWISYRLGGGESTWGKRDGVYSFRNDTQKKGLPANARIVIFHGKNNPWDADVQRKHRWVREHWR